MITEHQRVILTNDLAPEGLKAGESSRLRGVRSRALPIAESHS